MSQGNGHAPAAGQGNGVTSGRYGPDRADHFVVAERAADAASEEDDELEEEPREVPRRDVRGEVGSLIDSLRAVFEQDRATASSGGNARCGICYLHYPLTELDYRTAEGYYVCAPCAQRLGSSRLPMVRKQQR